MGLTFVMSLFILAIPIYLCFIYFVGQIRSSKAVKVDLTNKILLRNLWEFAWQ